VFGVVAAVLGSVVFGVIVNLSASSFALVLVLTIVVNLIVVSCWGVITTYINERFHTGIRASGFGLGYSLAVVIPSFYVFYQSWLSHVMPSKYTALVLLVIGGVLISVGAAMGPETRDSSSVRRRRATRSSLHACRLRGPQCRVGDGERVAAHNRWAPATTWRSSVYGCSMSRRCSRPARRTRPRRVRDGGDQD